MHIANYLLNNIGDRKATARTVINGNVKKNSKKFYYAPVFSF